VKKAEIGVIGGSGIYEIEGLEDVEDVECSTPFGPPSDAIRIGTLEGRRVAFLPRHGRGHRLSPSEVPYKANIYALKTLGVERIISLNAVGSLREEIKPLDFVIPDQIIDRTKGRESTFFGEGIVAHINFADPFCPELSEILYRAALEEGVRAHRGGVYVVIEGPAFSTRAESKLHKLMGGTVVGMTVIPEAKLAREAEICYAALASVTDMDVWMEGSGLSALEIARNLLLNAERAKRIIRRACALIPKERKCSCGEALKGVIITRRDLIPQHRREQLGEIIGKYL